MQHPWPGYHRPDLAMSVYDMDRLSASFCRRGLGGPYTCHSSAGKITFIAIVMCRTSLRANIPPDSERHPRMRSRRPCISGVFFEVKRCGCHGRPVCPTFVSYFAERQFSSQPAAACNHVLSTSPARAFAICCGVTFTCNNNFVWRGTPASTGSRLLEASARCRFKALAKSKLAFPSTCAFAATFA